VPEGPELRHSRDILRTILVEKSISRFFTTSQGRYREKEPEGLSEVSSDLPLKIQAIDTKGKFMWWTLEGKSKTWYMWCTYGMSGQWSRTFDKHTGFVVEYSNSGSLILRDQQKIFFNDQRRFGTIKFVDEHKLLTSKLKSLGPDILDEPPISPDLFAKRILLKHNRTISEALMDQSCVSGIGNYLKAEILFRSGVSPLRNAIDLSAEEIYRIYEETLKASRESYSDHGASIRTYKTVNDSKGKAQFYFRVYGKESCPIGHKINREQTKDGRTSWWCSTCQK
jgi:formamidopyrimidine-DNA glycosylase